MPDFAFPTSNELLLIAQDKMPRLTQDRVGFQLFPLRNSDNYLISWEQRDIFAGLAQVRGLNGAPPKVQPLGAKRYQMQPGIYGEYRDLDEMELTVRRQWGSFNQPIDVADMTMDAQDYLLLRLLDRLESIIWTLAATFTFSVPGPLGAVLHTDSYTGTTFTASVPWATFATATPLANFRFIQLLGRGHSVNFGAVATAYMNRVTANNLLSNSNNADLYGRRTQGLGTFNSEAQVNQLLVGDDLPQIMVYDEGYISAGTFIPFIPDNRIVVIGKRPAGQTVGEMLLVRNANNPGMAPGIYQKVVDNGDEAPPRNIQVHAGVNAGPALYFPSSIISMQV